MSSIRKTKKAMKKSNGFFTVVMNNNMCFCTTEWHTLYTLKYHKHGIVIGNAGYLPYKLIRRLIIGR